MTGKYRKSTGLHMSKWKSNGLECIVMAGKMIKSHNLINKTTDKTTDIKNNEKQTIAYAFDGARSTLDHFNFIWDFYLSHVNNGDYVKIGKDADPAIVFLMRQHLMRSTHIVDKMLFHLVQTCIDIGYLKLNDRLNTEKISSQQSEIFSLKKQLDELKNINNNAGNAELSSSYNMGTHNLNKYLARLNLEVGLFMYYYGYQPTTGADKEKYNEIIFTIRNYENTVVNGVLLTRKYMQERLVYAMDNNLPFSLLNK